MGGAQQLIHVNAHTSVPAVDWHLAHEATRISCGPLRIGWMQSKRLTYAMMAGDQVQENLSFKLTLIIR
jgi:hypothetical protein